MTVHEISAAAETRTRDRTAAPGKSRARSWRVIHACEFARDVLPVVEGQLAAGMQPYIVTPQDAGTAELFLAGKNPEPPRTLSLLRSWQDVRHWRKSILDCDPENSAEIVHAHSFAAGMAAARSCSCVVYDFAACIEELAVSTRQCESGSWMARSFRAAEQFILSRAAAVIVHSLGMKEAALERGAPPEAVFLIPDPLLPEDDLPASSPAARNAGLAPEEVAFFVPQCAMVRRKHLSPAATTVLEALALASCERPHSRLLLEAPAGGALLLSEEAARLRVATQIGIVSGAEVLAAWQYAHVVVALGEPPADPLAARRPNSVCLQTLRRGIALLADDLPRNRDASPEGRGCLWFEANNARDLASRMVFLAHYGDFRAALAAAGRSYLLETRNPAAIGKKYGEAYRYAASRRKPVSKGPGVTILAPAANWG